MTYARGRLWLGVSTVGTLVSLSVAGLLTDAPASLLGETQQGILTEAGLWGFVVLAYLLVHIPFDVVGGWWLPRQFSMAGHAVQRLSNALLLSAVRHACLLWVIGLVFLLSARLGGLSAVVLSSVAIASLLLRLREGLAVWVGGVSRDHGDRYALEAADTGFTGGVSGLLANPRLIAPSAWRHQFDAETLARLLKRREAAIASGSWRRGQAFAMAFVACGIAASGFLAGADRLGTSAGLASLSLWFTLWSFGGLLALPMLSRWAVTDADRRAGLDAQDLEALVKVEEMGDQEPRRTTRLEAVFHPIPSVSRRERVPSQRRPAFWDVARTSLFLSAAGLGLLGRAVHCNCGRPALWVFLPSA